MSHLPSIRKLGLGLLATAIVVGVVSLVTTTKPASRPRAPSRDARITPPAPRAFHVDEPVRTALVDYAKRPASAIGLDPTGARRGKTAMRAIVSRSVDLPSARKRVSMRFDRTSYTQPSARDVPMHLGDRPGTLTAAPTGTVSVVYRESASGHVMSFDKLAKEKAVPTGDGLGERDAAAQARAFVIGNGLVGETATDAIAEPEVRARRIDQEGGSDFLVQQDIVLRRMFDGKPVINSMATVSVLPEPGHEIVGVKVANWIPVQDGARRELKPAYDEAAAKKLAVNLETQLADVLAQELGADAQGAVVREVVEGWFSSERDGLIPALVFAVELREGRTATIAMTPYHDSTQIWQQGRRSRLPESEPDFAE